MEEITIKSTKRRKKKNPKPSEKKPISELFQNPRITPTNGKDIEDLLTSPTITELKEDVEKEDNKEVKEKIKEMNLSYSFLEARFKAMVEQLEDTKSSIDRAEIEKSEVVKKSSEQDAKIKSLNNESNAMGNNISELTTKLQNKLTVREKFEADFNELQIFLQSKTKEYEELVNKKTVKKVDKAIQKSGKMEKQQKIITIKE